MADATFYFDFISPYAYFAHLRVAKIEAKHGATITYRPILFAGLLDHHGQLGPAEIESKRDATFRDIARYAARNAIPLTGPASHPFVPTTALRLALPEVSGDDHVRVTDILFREGWGRGIDLGSPTALADVLTDQGLPGAAWVARTREPEIKAVLRRNTEAAIERGVFGVPTFDVAGELVWGNDRISTVEALLAGTDPLPRGAAQRLLNIPRGVERPKSRGIPASSARSRLVFVTGPPGVGTSDLTQRLFEALPNAAWLDGDDVWRVRPRVVEPRTKEQVESNISAVLQGHLRAGFEVVLLTWRRPRPDIIESLARRIGRPPDVILALTCSPDVLVARRERRGETDHTGALQRLREVEATYDDAIDTSDMTPDQVVAAMQERLISAR